MGCGGSAGVKVQTAVPEQKINNIKFLLEKKYCNVNEDLQIEITELHWHLKLGKMRLGCQTSVHILFF